MLEAADDIAETIVSDPVSSDRKGWDGIPIDPAGLSATDLADWHELRIKIRVLAASEAWSMGEVARRADIPLGTFSPWYSGKYRGAIPETTRKLRLWLKADETRRTYVPAIAEPGFVATPTALAVIERLMLAQELPGIAVIHLAPGMGKTSTIDHVVQTTPHVYAITASPSLRTVPGLNRAIAVRLGIDGRHPGQLRDLIRTRLAGTGARSLLIVDEAQNLGDDAVNELRHYRDRGNCGLALVGNHDVVKRWGARKPETASGTGDAVAQLHRRISIRLILDRPSQADIDAYVAAWGINDPAITDLLRAIGRKPGALGQISETVKLAAIWARGGRRALSADDIRRAWDARADEGGLA